MHGYVSVSDSSFSFRAAGALFALLAKNSRLIEIDRFISGSHSVVDDPIQIGTTNEFYAARFHLSPCFDPCPMHQKRRLVMDWSFFGWCVGDHFRFHNSICFIV